MGHSTIDYYRERYGTVDDGTAERAWLREVLDIPPTVRIPLDAWAGIMATIDNDATALDPDWTEGQEWTAAGEEWRIPSGWSPADCRSSDEEPGDNEWCGDEGPPILQTRVEYIGPIGEVMRWAEENVLDAPASWDANNGGLLTWEGIRPCAHATDLHPMDWNIGGVTPVFMATATIFPA